MGSDSVQLRPSGRHSKVASPPSWLVTEAVMILVPNPCAAGARVAGPPLSTQCSRKEPASSSQLSLTFPAGDDSAPYLAALVASSCSASARICAVTGRNDTCGPLAVILSALVR